MFIEKTFSATSHPYDARTVDEFTVQKTMPDGATGKDTSTTYEIKVGNGCANMTTAQAMNFVEGFLKLLPPRREWSSYR